MGVELTENAARRLGPAVRWVERQAKNEVGVRRGPKEDIGGGSACPAQNAIIQVVVMGKPTGGTFPIVVTVNNATETLTFDWNDDATAATAVMETHSEIGSGDVTVRGGPFPNTTMVIEFQGALAETDIALPYGSWSSLTGGTGVAVITTLSQRGIA